MYLKTEGLVLRVSPFQEADAMLSVLTRGHGLLSVRARGLRLFRFRRANVIDESGRSG